MHAVGGWESAEKPGRWALVATCVVAAGFCLSLYLRHNDFPAAYHPDEANKGRAVVFNEWRFRQPLLLISTTWLTARLTGSDGSVQEAVVVGRWVSAFFATGAVVLLVLAAHRAGGASAAVLVAVAVPACPRLLVAAHYMKEDTALLLGLSAFAAAAAWLWVAPGRRSLACLGAACGLAATGKFLGAVTVPVAAWVVWSALRRPNVDPALRTWRAAVLTPLLGALAVLAVVQLPTLQDPLRAMRDLAWELKHPVTSHHGVVYPRFHRSPFIPQLLQETPPVVLALGLAYALATIARWRATPLPRQVPVVLFVVLFAVVICSSVTFPRYLLPAQVWMHVMAGLAAAHLVTRAARTAVARAAVTAALAVAIGWNFPREARPLLAQFHTDSREVVRQWLAGNVPAGSGIAYERHAALPDEEAVAMGMFAPQLRLPARVERFRDLPDAGELETLRDAGIEFVVVSDHGYARYLDPTTTGRKSARPNSPSARTGTAGCSRRARCCSRPGRCRVRWCRKPARR
jgi:hypothetical protein